MKKYLSLILSLIFLFLFTACGEPEEEIAYRPNMLKFSTEDKDYQGVVARFRDVIKVLSVEVNTLEESQNDTLRYKYPDDYFLNDEYILLSFNPFENNGLSITDRFNDKLDLDTAKINYSIDAGDRNIIFNQSENSYTLKFSDENATDIYTSDYNSDENYFSFKHTVDTPSGSDLTEFTEFYEISANTFVMQSKLERCYASFDDIGNITSFYYSSLNPDAPNNSPSLYVNSLEGSGAKSWVFEEPKENYFILIEFKNKVLTHSDNSSGELKTFKINEKDYESAFYINNER